MTDVAEVLFLGILNFGIASDNCRFSGRKGLMRYPSARLDTWPIDLRE